MTTHRNDITAAVQAQLAAANITVDGVQLTADRIYRSRAKPVTPDMMPALMVYMGEERRDPQEHDGSLFHRRIVLVVEGAITAPADVIDAMANELAKAIENAIEADRTLGNLVIETRWQTTDADAIASGRGVVAAVRIEYDCEVYTDEYIPKGLGLTPDPWQATEVKSDPHIVQPPDNYYHPVRPPDSPAPPYVPPSDIDKFLHGDEIQP